METERKPSESTNTILETIPHDLVLEILVSLASSSSCSSDFCNMKQSSKTLNELGNNSYVLRNVSLDGIDVVQWEPSAVFNSFLPRCEESGNPEALYRRGMVEYFCNNQREFIGLKFLERATKLGHEEATYVLGIILLCNKDESKERGMELLNMVEKRKRARNNIGLSESRNKCKAIVRKIWLNNLVCPEEPLCSTSCNNKKRKIAQRLDLSDQDEQVFDCKACKWDHERTLFHNMLCGSA